MSLKKLLLPHLNHTLLYDLEKGIDIPHRPLLFLATAPLHKICYVVHADLPGSLEVYIQCIQALGSV